MRTNKHNSIELKLTEEYKSHVKNLLIKLRYESNISQNKVLKDTGINVSRIECGESGCGIESLIKLVNYYGYHLKLCVDKPDESTTLDNI